MNLATDVESASACVHAGKFWSQNGHLNENEIANTEFNHIPLPFHIGMPDEAWKMNIQIGNIMGKKPCINMYSTFPFFEHTKSVQMYK